MEVVYAVGQVGGSLGPPVGYFMEKTGPALSFVAALILGFTSCMLIFSSTLSIFFYHKHFWLLSLYFFIFGNEILIMLNKIIIC